MNMYYLWINDAQAGPYTLAQVKSMWNAGQITATSLFWQEGRNDWEPLRVIQNLIEPLPVAPAPRIARARPPVDQSAVLEKVLQTTVAASAAKADEIANRQFLFEAQKKSAGLACLLNFLLPGIAEVEKVNRMEQQAWLAWEATRTPLEHVSVTQTESESTGDGPTGSFCRKTKTNAGHKTKVIRNGDTRYMNIIQWCVQQRCRILGLYMPTEIEVSSNGEAKAEKMLAAVILKGYSEGDIKTLTRFPLMDESNVVEGEAQDKQEDDS